MVWLFAVYRSMYAYVPVNITNVMNTCTHTHILYSSYYHGNQGLPNSYYLIFCAHALWYLAIPYAIQCSLVLTIY